MTPRAVGEDVGDDEDAALVQVLVRVGRRRAVGAFDDDLRADARRVVHRDLVLERGRNQDVDVELEELLVGQRLGAGEARRPSCAAARTRAASAMSRPFAL